MASEAGSRLWEDAERSECCEMLWSIGPETILLWICRTEHNWAQCPCEERSSRTHTAACDPACLNFAAALEVTSHFGYTCPLHITKGSVSVLQHKLRGYWGPARAIHGILAVMYWISIIGGGGPPPPENGHGFNSHGWRGHGPPH